MNVLFLSQIVPYPPHGGVLQRGFNLLREASREAQVHLLAFVHPDVLPTEDVLTESRKALSEFCASVEYFPLWAKGSPLQKAAALAASAFSSVPFSVIAHRSSEFRQRVAAAMAAVPFDLVHVDTLALSQFIDPALRLPKVLTHHNIESMLMRRRAQAESGRLARRFLRRETAKLEACELVTARQFDVNIMMSARDAATLEQRIPGVRTAVVPNGVDIRYFSPSAEPESEAIIYTGGMNMFANRDAVMHFLTDIWPIVRERAPRARFFAVGQDPPKSIREVAAADPRVVVTGFVDDIRPYVREAAVYAVPLRVGGGTRLKVLDAMAMGKAMVSTSIGFEGIEATPGEHLVIADTAESFAEAILSLLADPTRRQALGRAARGLVERRYAWPVVGDRLFDAYRQAIAGGPGR